MPTVRHAELGNFCVMSTFCTNNQLQNAKITQKIPSCATFLSGVRVNSGMRMYMNEYGRWQVYIKSACPPMKSAFLGLVGVY